MPRWLETTTTRNPARLSRAIASGTPGSRLELAPGGHIAAFRHLFVEHAVAVEEYGAQGSERKAVGGVGHPVMIATAVVAPGRRAERVLNAAAQRVREPCPVVPMPQASSARPLRSTWRLCARLESQQPVLEAIARAMTATLRAGGKILWCGNGGSAADSQHLAAELVGRFRRERRGLASLALTTDSSDLTSVANDYGYEAVFSRQVEALGVAGDLLVGISTSGNSRNVVAALEAARTRGLATVAFTGAGGGRMATWPIISLPSRRSETARIQEAHILAGHMLCDWIELDCMNTMDAGGRCGSTDRRSRADRGSAMIEQLHEVIQEIEQQVGRQAPAGGGRRDARQVHLGRGGPHLAGGAGARGARHPPERAARRRGQRGHEPGPSGRARRWWSGLPEATRTRRLLAAACARTESRRSLSSREGFPTITKQRILGGRQQMLRLDSERLGARSAGRLRPAGRDACWRISPGCHAVVLSDYAKGVLDAGGLPGGDSGRAQAGDSGAGRSQERRLHPLPRRHDHLPQPAANCATGRASGRRTSLKALLDAAEAMVPDARSRIPDRDPGREGHCAGAARQPLHGAGRGAPGLRCLRRWRHRHRRARSCAWPPGSSRRPPWNWPILPPASWWARWARCRWRSTSCWPRLLRRSPCTARTRW